MDVSPCQPLRSLTFHKSFASNHRLINMIRNHAPQVASYLHLRSRVCASHDPLYSVLYQICVKFLIIIEFKCSAGSYDSWVYIF